MKSYDSWLNDSDDYERFAGLTQTDDERRERLRSYDKINRSYRDEDRNDLQNREH